MYGTVGRNSLHMNTAVLGCSELGFLCRGEASTKGEARRSRRLPLRDPPHTPSSHSDANDTTSAMGLISRRKPVPKVSTAPLAAPHPAQEAESLPDEQAAAGLANADTDDEEEPLYNNPAVDFNHPTAVRPSENDTAISEDTEENVMPPTENDWKADEESCNKGRATLDENQGGNPCITKKKSRANPVAEPRATHGSKCPEDKVAPALRLVKRSKSKQPCEDSDVLDEACTACGRTDGGMHMLLCDGAHCSAAWHMGCLEPPLKQLPRGNWYCPDCTERHIAKRLKRANAKSSSGSSSSSSSSLVAPPQFRRRPPQPPGVPG